MLVTLVYLALQIRQGNQVATADARGPVRNPETVADVRGETSLSRPVQATHSDPWSARHFGSTPVACISGPEIE